MSSYISAPDCDHSADINIYEKADKFVEDTIYNTDVPNHKLLDHILQYISTLRLIDLYMLAKHIPEYRQPKSIVSEEARAGYIYLIYTTYMREIQKKRKELYILYHTKHIVNAGSEEDIYNCIAHEILYENAEVEELLNMLLYGIEFELFDVEVMEPVNEAVMRIQSKCVLSTDENGNQVIQFVERPMLTCSLRHQSSPVPYNCEICYEEYPNTKNRVHLGDCTHSFCFECVQKHASSRPSYCSTIECPFCRTKTNKLEFTCPIFLRNFIQPPLPNNNNAPNEYISIMNFL